MSDLSDDARRMREHAEWMAKRRREGKSNHPILGLVIVIGVLVYVHEAQPDLWNHFAHFFGQMFADLRKLL